MNTDIIRPEQFYSRESEKTKFNWFCYEYALELNHCIDSTLRKRLAMKMVEEHAIAEFCVHYAKSLKPVILSKLSEKSDMILSYHEIERVFPDIDDQLIDELLTKADQAWKSLLDVCVTCPTRCLSERDRKASMF